MTCLSRPAVLGVGIAAVLALSPSAGAVGNHTAATGTETAPVMIVLDASGSMNTADAPGPRIAAAKHAVDGLAGSLPGGARVGLEVYGTSTSSAASAKAAGCRDIKVVVPVGRLHRASFVSTVNRVKASGYTPIGSALRKAAAELPDTGPRSIVLVSDGEDTCAPPDPCTVAKQLKRAGVDLVVHTVGFKVDAKARAQLKCIADATGGTYRDAANGPALSHRLQIGVQRGLQPYVPTGIPIHGTPSAAGAPELQPGQYLDTYDQPTTAKYYTVTLHKGETPYLSATLIPATVRSGGSITISAMFTDLDQSGCVVYGSGLDTGFGAKVSASTAVVSPGEVGGPGWPSDCPSEGRFAVKFSRGGSAFRTEPLKVEIDYRLEPPADATGQPPAAAPMRLLHINRLDRPIRPIGAGSSFNDAPLVRPGVYRDTVVSGETRFYRVHLAWGQRLSYIITPQKRAHLGISGGMVGYTHLANPLRQDLRQPRAAHAAFPYMGSTSGALDGSSLVPVRYNNRTSHNDAVRPYSVDGDYYLIFSVGYPPRGSLRLSYTLGVRVTGTADPGPKYRPIPGSSTGASAAPSTAPPRTKSPSASATGSAVSPSGRTSKPSRAATAADGGTRGGLSPAGVLIVVGAIAVALGCLTTAVLLARRRRLYGRLP